MKKWISLKTLMIIISLLGVMLCATGLVQPISGNPRNYLLTAIGSFCIVPVGIYNIIRSRKR